MSLSTTAIIPAHNEEMRLEETLAALASISGVDHLIVVDDGSSDSTANIATDAGAEVITASSKGKPTGKGNALLLGLARARRRTAEAMMMADADLGSSATRLSRLLEALEAGKPVTIARFPPAKGAGFGLVKNYARRGILRRTGYCPAEPLSGQRALRTDAVDALPGIAPGFGAEVGMTLDLLAAGITPTELPIDLQHRSTGRNLSGATHRARQGLDVIRAFRGQRIAW